MTRTRAALTALPVLLFMLLTGCGKDLFVPLTEHTATGNWYVSGTYAGSNGTYPSYDFGGSLFNTTGNLSGIFHTDTSCFGNGTTDIPYTGTMDNNSNLSIVSSPVSGQILTLKGKLSLDGSSITDGNFTVTGGCTGSIVSIPPTDLTGAHVRTTALRISLTGNWETPAGEPSPFAEQLTQASTPDAHGDYALTGTVTIQGYPCFTQGVLQPGSFLSGNLGNETIRMNDGSILNASLILGYYQGVQYSFQLDYGTITGGNCDGDFSADLQQ